MAVFSAVTPGWGAQPAGPGGWNLPAAAWLPIACVVSRCHITAAHMGHDDRQLSAACACSASQSAGMRLSP